MKGNTARALMYQAVSYNGQSGLWAFPDQISFTIPYGQDAEVIKNWHFQDLPDNYEIARNEYIYSIQGNRNPFVDSVNFACYIDFSNMSYNANACNVGINELVNDKLAVYPVPASQTLFVEVDGIAVNGYSIMDLQGRVIETKKDLNASVVEINAAAFTSGTYLVLVSTAQGEAQRKIVIE